MTGGESGKGNVRDTTETTVFVEKNTKFISKTLLPRERIYFFAGISVFCCSRVWFNSKRTRSKKNISRKDVGIRKLTSTHEKKRNDVYK